MSKREGGRENPRTARVREIVLEAALELLLSHGGEEVTALRVSERSGVARSTIYRHWPDPPSLLLDAVDRIAQPGHPTTITADLEQDLHTVLSNLRARMDARPFRVVFAALLSHASRDPAFVEAQRHFVWGVLSPLRDILGAAVERGRLPCTLDVESTCAQLAGPLLTQHVMLHRPIDDALLWDVVRQFLVVHGSAPDGALRL